ncbi:AMP-binding protein [Aquincola sp. S2]|uniref:AMP-binding protein n=1 Tax=Pseudaquabacterium terrae TaxID=2732868 RepID=A0ABX2EGE5_9BURK|nr:AMP-binding protein [Aquabacterium terrae]NRF67672.1 AMP-binding protein [Aquabacterium terrae]
MYLTQGLQRALQRHPSKLALRHLGAGADRAHSFAQMAASIARQAAALAAHGVRAGDRVAMLSPNNDALIVQLFACWWLGAVACPLNLRWSVPELRHALADCGARLLLADASQAAAAAELRAACEVWSADELAARAAALEPIADTRTGGDALACILYTGGTTGRAKGVMLTHANFWSASMTRGAELNNSPEHVTLLVAPLFHVAGLGRLIGQSIVGGSCLTLPQFRPETVLDAIEANGINDLIVVPSMLQSLLETPGFRPERVKSLRRIAFGAAPMPPDLLARALAACPQAEFFQAYGLTETAGAVCINLPENHRLPAHAAGRLASVGRAGLGAEIRIVDEHGVDVPRGQVGEIIVRGPMVMPGYWNQPAASAEALRDGWFHTGDGGRMDAEGYLFIADRLKDMIISGGENVYPAEVEAALRSHPAVADAAVIGVPDVRWGEAVHAVIVLRGPASDGAAPALHEALVMHCRERLAGYKCPRGISVVDALPLSAAGKVLKAQLRQAFNT